MRCFLDELIEQIPTKVQRRALYRFGIKRDLVGKLSKDQADRLLRILADAASKPNLLPPKHPH